MKLILVTLLIASPMVLATDFDPNFSSDFGIVIQDEQTLTIKHGVSNSSFVNADTSIKLKSLHMKKGSLLIVDYSAGHTRIEALEATFDEGSSIIVEGKDGHKVGEDGYPSSPLTLTFPKLKMNGAYFKAVGGDGAKGATGVKGKNAGQKKCSSGDGWPAENGGRGGVGGKGGSNNNIVLYTASPKSELDYTVDFVAGKGGEGGTGGQGGDGAPGKKCIGYKRGSRPPGKIGPPGASGKKGETGQFIVINITS
ncbi:hypothetical protein L1D37_18140 [Vibrio sp. Isolate33]|uniref:hypothetical protein n=1 Tax=Vibrio sp. Isolate33 TaxID=2908539 RepID=UPI001EFD3CEB|nr:hypothetical protein [Vibrio sp. Isolate33]MCG9545660.1 hypothetical protein [Vibrio sp. Isolate33]